MGKNGKGVESLLERCKLIFSSVPDLKVVLLGLIAVFLIGLLDYVTGYELSFGIFYLVPIVLVTWRRGFRMGTLISLLCACIWLLVDLASGHQYSNFVIPYWNAGVRLGFFLGFAFLMNRVKLTSEALLEAKTQLEIRVQERTTELQKATELLSVELAERKRAEEALWRSEVRYRMLFRTVPIGLLIADLAGNVPEINRAMEATTGFSQNEIESAGGIASLCATPDECKQFLEFLLEAGKVRNHEMRLQRKDGTIYWGLLNGDLVALNGQEQILVALRDITARKLANEETRKLKQQIELILGITKTGLDIIDSQFNLHYVDPFWAKVYGDPAGRKCYEYFMGRSEVCPGCGVQKALETKMPVTSEEILVRENNRPIQVTTIPFQNEKGEWLTAEVNVDITERKRLADERERYLKELEQRNAEMERFVYTISHELRTPLVTAQAYTDLLRRDLERRASEKVAADLRFIENAVSMMARLLEDTLELSRTGRVMSPPEDVPFSALVRDALVQLTEQLKWGGVEVAVAEDFPTVHVDRTRLVEVLVNLIENSIKFMGDQPKPKIEIGYRTADNEPIFFVKDNGIGLEKSQHEKVFQLFYKMDKESKGSGAGLTIVKRIVEVHGGRIWIESELGKGCTVCFTLPMV
jgi:PAS domain S-box-containing protein